MSLLKQVTTGRIKTPHLVLIYGIDGIGKSSFGANAPRPIFLGPEMGTANLDVARLPAPSSFADVLMGIKALTEEAHDYETLVIDSLDWIEPLVWNVVCQSQAKRVESIEDIGYMKGYIYALDHWKKMIEQLNLLRDRRGMNIVLIAHSMVKQFNDPENPAYDKYQLKLHEKAAALWREYADSVLFANYQVSVVKDKAGDRKGRGVGDGARVIYTQGRPAFNAKSRYNVPHEIPLSWEDYAQAVALNQPRTPDQLRKDIGELLTQVKDQALREKVVTYLEQNGSDTSKLELTLNRLRTLTNAA